MLNTEECEELAEIVISLRNYWDRIPSERGRYKLGAAAFAEGRQGAQHYVRASRDRNRLLELHFGPFYDHLQFVLSEELGGSVMYATGLAKPGFDIVLAEEGEESANSAVHRDDQHRFLPWLELPDDSSRTCTFTLPIALPAIGGGLRTWAEGASTAPGEYHPYLPGEIVIHPGSMLHQDVAVPEGVGASQSLGHRITLQGHGLYIGSGWQFYL
ncbi:hypothetical protein [Streptomyces sp. NPDC085932]|uniref:hypothetical protein n=1 Tax=Streptomyces sp. NPDC085932 TaxID=3365741 RepID=UPI0037D2B6DA